MYIQQLYSIHPLEVQARSSLLAQQQIWASKQAMLSFAIRILISAWTSLNPQNSNSANLELEKPEKLILPKPKLEIFEQKLSLIHAPTRQFETRWNSNSIKSEKLILLKPKLEILLQSLSLIHVPIGQFETRAR